MNPYELRKFGSVLVCINIHYCNITDGNAEYSIHIYNQGELLHVILHIFLVLHNNHYTAIFCKDGFLRFMLHAHQVICDTCQKIITTPTHKKAHTCTFKYDVQDNEPSNLR